MLIAVLAMMVVFTLGTALLSVAASNFTMDQAEHDYQAAYYAAEGGLRHQMEAMKLVMEDLYTSGNYTNAAGFFNDFWNKIQQKYTLDFGMINNKAVKAEITTSRGTIGNDAREYKIVSTGSVGRIKRTLESTVRIRFVPPAGDISALFDYAVFANGKIEQSSNASSIVGNVGTNGGNGAVNLKNYSGNIETDCNLALPSIIFPSDNGSGETLVVDKNQTFTGGGRYSSIVIDKKSELTIQLNGDTIIFTDVFEMRQKSSIKLRGEGRLIIYIKNSFNLDGNINLNGDPRKLIVFYAGKTIDNGTLNNFSFYGGLYAPNLNLHLSGQFDIKGSIVVKEVKITGTGDIVFSKVYDEENPITMGGISAGFSGDMFTVVSYNEIN
nr:MAG: hypothetical protein DIU64_11845 [Caldicoprobacter oshimai]